jgi:IS5 family transposase
MPEQDFFRHPLCEQVDLKNPAVRLAALNNRKRLLTLMSESFVSGKRVNS